MKLLALRILKDLHPDNFGPSIAYTLQRKYQAAGCGTASVYNALKSLCDDGFVCKLQNSSGKNKYSLSPSGYALLLEFQITQPKYSQPLTVSISARAS